MTATYEFVSSNPEIATVSEEGIVTGVKIGSATIGSAGLVVSNYGSINNCIVDYTMSLTSGVMPAAVVAMNNAGATINNTAAIVTCGVTINYQNVNSGTKLNTPIYTAHSDFYATKGSFIKKINFKREEHFCFSLFLCVQHGVERNLLAKYSFVFRRKS